MSNMQASAPKKAIGVLPNLIFMRRRLQLPLYPGLILARTVDH
ncbi:hypothetical protein SAMN04515619_13141 [Collimonas sp. OK412]|jgi:hypothetical protein|nr:hypothetical protein SAMN04515619_13141 [Collimonas sp. OK412]